MARSVDAWRGQAMIGMETQCRRGSESHGAEPPVIEGRGNEWRGRRSAEVSVWIDWEPMGTHWHGRLGTG